VGRLTRQERGILGFIHKITSNLDNPHIQGDASQSYDDKALMSFIFLICTDKQSEDKEEKTPKVGMDENVF
jgi:hypothetical protein